MSYIGYCHRGGQNGIVTDTDEMEELSVAIESKYIDEYIPLPSMNIDTQVRKIRESEDDDTYNNVIYWESNTGAHGWCNKETGKVVQWG